MCAIRGASAAELLSSLGERRSTAESVCLAALSLSSVSMYKERESVCVNIYSYYT